MGAESSLPAAPGPVYRGGRSGATYGSDRKFGLTAGGSEVRRLMAATSAAEALTVLPAYQEHGEILVTAVGPTMEGRRRTVEALVVHLRSIQSPLADAPWRALAAADEFAAVINSLEVSIPSQCGLAIAFGSGTCHCGYLLAPDDTSPGTITWPHAYRVARSDDDTDAGWASHLQHVGELLAVAAEGAALAGRPGILALGSLSFIGPAAETDDEFWVMSLGDMTAAAPAALGTRGQNVVAVLTAMQAYIGRNGSSSTEV